MTDEEKKKPAAGAGKSGEKKSAAGAGKSSEKKKGGGRKGAGPAQLAQPVTNTPQEYVQPRLKKRYDAEIIPALTRQFGYSSPMQVPRVMKITLNMGLGEAVSNAKIIDSSVLEIMAIAGQKPVVTKARKSIATFKLRQGLPIGVMVTLRRARMWEFLDRLISFALPRVRDFKGISPKAFDGAGNYTLGLKEQIIFPEIDYDKVDKIKGLNISIVTTARNDEEGRALLQHLGMPFRQ